MTTIASEKDELVPAVRKHRLPLWLKDRLKAGTGLKRDSDVMHAFQSKFADGGWLDHWGTAVYGEDEMLVSEPYGLTGYGVACLREFCTRFGLEFRIDAESRHYPGKTLRIIVSQDLRS